MKSIDWDSSSFCLRIIHSSVSAMLLSKKFFVQFFFNFPLCLLSTPFRLTSPTPTSLTRLSTSLLMHRPLPTFCNLFLPFCPRFQFASSLRNCNAYFYPLWNIVLFHINSSLAATRWRRHYFCSSTKTCCMRSNPNADTKKT